MLGVLILAGGEATRFPGKLECEFAGEPLVVRVFRNVRGAGPAYIAANRTFAAAIDAALECPLIVDRKPGGGPLAALYGSLGEIGESHVFVVAGDAPFVHAGTAAELQAYWHADLDGVVALDSHGNVQPLCAVYARLPLLEAAGAALKAGSGSLKAALDRLRIRYVRLSDERVHAGINTPEDFVAVRTFDLGIRAGA